MTRLLTSTAIAIAAGALLSGCGDSGASKPNVAIGPPASTTQQVSQLILKAHGVEEADYSAYQEGFGAALDGVQDGNIDISMGILGLPSGSIENLQAAAGDVVMLNLTDAAIDHIEANSDYRRFVIPKDSYEFLNDDVTTVTAYAVLVGNTHSIDDELGYELARLMYEKADENTHAQSAFMTLENALNGADGIPIHPGAKRYYEEQGLTVDGPVAEINITDGKNEYILGTGSQGGTYYPLGGEMATIWNNYLDNANFTNIETGASIENLVSIRDDRMDLGMTVHAPAKDAVEGSGEFDSGSIENVAFIGHIYPEVIQIVTRKKTGITSLQDLAK